MCRYTGRPDGMCSKGGVRIDSAPGLWRVRLPLHQHCRIVTSSSSTHFPFYPSSLPFPHSIGSQHTSETQATNRIDAVCPPSPFHGPRYLEPLQPSSNQLPQLDMGDSGGTTQRPVLHAHLFPHIIDKIIAHAPYPSLLAFRTTSKTFRKRIDALILDNILVWPWGRTSSRRGPYHRLPWTNFADEMWRVECVRIMDVHPDAMLSVYPCYRIQDC